MKRILFLIAVILSTSSIADELPAATRGEIAHLFAHLEQSGCRFNRNGSWYGARDAVAHLNRKYEYLVKKGLVSSAESFIERAATESSVSGKPYQVQCGSTAAVPSAAWFRAELERFRKAKP